MQDGILSIDWALSEPPVAPVGWQSWPLPHTQQTSPEAADADLERALAWPATTLLILRQAFMQRLSRTTGWEGGYPEIMAAARVYKRGVAFRRPGKKLCTTTESGRYEVKLWQGPTPPKIKGSAWQIVDGHVARYWPTAVRSADDLVLTLTEQSKTLASVATILSAAKAAGSPPHWRVLGGGLLADTAAFAAKLAEATIEFVPTTLLAMADACVGGKTGVNLPPFGKNQVGLFFFPKAVHVWAGWLRTLPQREWLSGGAECVKHLLLAGRLSDARAFSEALRSGNEAAVAAALPDIIAFKAQVVAADPAEQGQRAILNFGHTLGHALESQSQERTSGDDTLLHGEAVGIGMAFATLLSQTCADLSAKDAADIIDLLAAAGYLPTAAKLRRHLGVTNLHDPAVFEALSQWISFDKKNDAPAASRWVLLSAPGRVAQPSPREWTMPVATSHLEEAWQNLLQIVDQRV